MHTSTRRAAIAATPLAPRSASVDARIACAAATNHGVAGASRLAAIGVSRRALARRLHDGVLFEVLPRTYAHVPADQLTTLQRRAAALESMRAHPAALARVTAARMLDIWTRLDSERRVDIVSATHWRPDSVPWIDFHSCDSLPESDLLVVDQLTVTNVVRTCLDLAMCLTEHQLTNVLYEAEFKHGLDLRELALANARRAPYRGCDIARRAIAARLAGSVGTRSYAEDILLAALHRAYIEPPLVGNPNATPLPENEMDMVWPHLRLVVEVDGRPNHARTGDDARDDGEDRAYERIGWRVLRFDAEDVRADPGAIVAQIERAIHEQRQALGVIA